MWHTVDIVREVKPKYVIWENVKNLLSQKHRHNFDNYIEIMNRLGYNSYYQVLNAKDYGIPQNRERIYTISIRKDIDNYKFEFPKKEKLKLRLKDMLENKVDKKYYLNDEKISKFINNNKTIQKMQCDYLKLKENVIIGSTQANAAVNTNGICPTLTCAMGMGGGQIPMHNYDYKMRKLTPRECWRLMGFEDEDFYKAAFKKETMCLERGVKKCNAKLRAVNEKHSHIDMETTIRQNSDTVLYKQAGNSIVVNVLEKIFINLLKGE